MPNKLNPNWLSVHLYYSEPWESFLIKAVLPYLKTVVDTGISERFFFIRYWDKGPHIRLRFKAENTLIESLIKSNLREHFDVYFDAKPSSRIEPDYPANFPQDQKWISNNSLLFVDYEAETLRYGGEEGMEIAEAQFHASSTIVLESIKSKEKKWTYDDALGLAIKLHLSFAHAIGLDLEQTEAFFDFIFSNWLPKSFNFYRKKLSDKAFQEESKNTTHAFQKAFNLQKDQIVTYHAALWEALKKRDLLEDQVLVNWIKANEMVNWKYEALVHRDKLNRRSGGYRYFNLLGNDLDKTQEKLWSIYADFVHMTNNRLGILNQDEGYLGYLIVESLKELRTKKKEDEFYISSL